MASDLRSWENFRVFLTIAITGSLSASAPLLRSNIATVSRRLSELQNQLGVKLFHRHSKGMSLAPAGRLILADAKTMAAAVQNMEQNVNGLTSEMRGVVRISATEGVGAYWLTPRLLSFQRSNPGLTISLDTSNVARDLVDTEVDIAIRFSDPGDDKNLARRTGEIKMYAFAARAYLREFGKPETLDDLKNHTFVQYEDPPPGIIWDDINQVIANSRGIAFQSNSSNAVRRAIIEGYGIGFMPAYVKDIDSGIEILPICLEPSLKIWVLSRAETNQSRRVRATLDHIYQLFEIDRYRFFSDSGVTPIRKSG